MFIHIDAPSGRTTGVSLKPTDKVNDLKVRIEDEEWIPKGTMIKTSFIIFIDCVYYACTTEMQHLTYRNEHQEKPKMYFLHYCTK